MNPHSLKIQGAGMPPVILDKCTQTLEMVSLGGVHRTVNGALIYTGLSRGTKYQTVCKGVGKVAPGLVTLHRGDMVRVHSIQRLWQEMRDNVVTLARPAVEGTVLVMDEGRRMVPFTEVSSEKVRVDGLPEGGAAYISYCPLLTMRVLDIKLNTEEWGEADAWTITLEEE